MTISPAAAARYLWNADTSASITGPAIRLDMINAPSFNMLLGADDTAVGTFAFQVGNSVDTNNGAVFNPLVWVTIFTWDVAAGVFTLTGAKSFQFPDQLIVATDPPANYMYSTAAEGCRLIYTRTSGGAAASLNVSYFGKSFG